MTDTSGDFRVFLSHRYGAVDVNCYVYELLSKKAAFSFDVDTGKNPDTGDRLSTNVTLLEMAMRRAQAFIGVFAFHDGEPGPGPKRAVDARNESGYSVFELDIAQRMRRPGLVLCDKRIRSYFQFPAHYRVESLDVGMMNGALGRNQARGIEGSVTRFVEDLSKSTSHVRGADRAEDRKVALIVPRKKRDGFPFTTKQFALVVDLLKDYNWIPEPIEWDAIDYRVLHDLDRFEWVFMDISSPRFESLAGYVHGRGIPLMKAHRADRPPQAFRDMLGGYSVLGNSGVREIGYGKDMLAWRDARSLRAGLTTRLDRLRWGLKPIDAEVAENYFLDAARRTTPVFLSYSGDDEEQVRPYGDALRRRFSRVFDYRDGKSLKSGQPWGPQLEKSLSEAGLSVIMLSPSYLDKAPCRRESELMSNQKFEETLHVAVVKLANAPDGTTIKLAGHLSGDQYLRAWEHKNAEALIDQLIEDFDNR